MYSLPAPQMMPALREGGLGGLGIPQYRTKKWSIPQSRKPLGPPPTVKCCQSVQTCWAGSVLKRVPTQTKIFFFSFSQMLRFLRENDVMCNLKLTGPDLTIKRYLKARFERRFQYTATSLA